MVKWTLMAGRHLLRDDVVAALEFVPVGPGGWDHLEARSLATRIVALLNAAEPGGDIQKALDENPSPAAALRLWRLVDPAAVDRFTGAANASQT